MKGLFAALVRSYLKYVSASTKATEIGPFTGSFIEHTHRIDCITHTIDKYKQYIYNVIKDGTCVTGATMCEFCENGR